MVLVGSGSALASDAFSDVPDSHVFHDEINKLVELGIATGNADGTFGANMTITREAIMAFAYRTAGSPDGTYTTTFTDVPTTNAFYNAIAWAQTTGVTNGFADGTFRPSLGLSREAFAAFVYRLAGSPAGTNTESFSDVDSTDTFFDAISWAAANEIVNGYPDGTFKSAAAIKRQATAALLVRGVEKGVIGQTLVSNAALTVTPADAVSLTRVANPDTDTTDDRQYTIDGLDSTKSYVVALFSGADLQTDGKLVTFDDANSNNLADRTAPASDITVVNGASQAGNTSLVTVSPVNGTINFTVDGDGANESVVPVIWLDSVAGGTGDLNLTVPTSTNANPKAPSEAFGVGGSITFNPPAATIGDIGADVAITGVDKTANTFNTGAFVYSYDDNDAFYVVSTDTFPSIDQANRVTFEAFEAAVSAGDELDGTDGGDGTSYQPTASLPSTFVLENLAPGLLTTLAVTPGSTTAVGTVDTASVVSGATVTMKVVADGLACTTTAITTASSTTDANSATAEFQVNITGLTLSTDYELCAFQTSQGEVSGFTAAIALDTTPTSDTTVPTVTNTEITVDAATLGLLNDGDTIVIDFSEDMADTLGGGVTSYIRISDGDSTYQFECDGGVNTCTLDDGGNATVDDDRLTIATTDPTADQGLNDSATLVSGLDNGLDFVGSTTSIVFVSNTFDDEAGNQVDLAGSADVVVDDE
jgi:hypothetical protein